MDSNAKMKLMFALRILRTGFSVLEWAMGMFRAGIEGVITALDGLKETDDGK